MSASEPMRCRRCGGSGDVPIVTDEGVWDHLEARPLLQACPDCVGTGFAKVDEAQPQKSK